MSDIVFPAEADLDARCEWAHAHGLDPEMIPLDEPIEIDYLARRIIYKRFVLDPPAKAVWIPGGKVLTIRVVLQLESPPRPFPTGAVRARRPVLTPRR